MELSEGSARNSMARKIQNQFQTLNFDSERIKIESRNRFIDDDCDRCDLTLGCDPAIQEMFVDNRFDYYIP